MGEGHEEEGGKEDANGREGGSAPATDEVSHKGGRGEYGTRGELTDGHRIEELLLGEPAQLFNKVLLHEGEEYIPCAIERAPDLEKLKKEPEGRIGLGRGQDRREEIRTALD